MTLNTDPGLADFSPYQVQSRREIISLLRAIEERNQLVSLLINHGSEAVVTSVLEIDETNNIVVVDCAPNNLLNQRITASDHISFETVLDHIRILFSATRVDHCTYDNLPALRFALPTTLVRLQRRDAYRVATPISNPVRCTLQIPDETGEGLMTISVALQNISAGGVALIDEKKILDKTIGRLYPNCRIDIPGGTPVVATLQVRNAQELTFTNGKSIRRIGCMFIDLPRAMLAAVQRYITKLEREQNARVRPG